MYKPSPIRSNPARGAAGPDRSSVAARCGCHEWHPVPTIGGWMVRRGGSDLVLVPRGRRRRDLAPGPLRAQPRGADRPGAGCRGIACGYALKATTLLSGEIGLTNGLHRWVVATELGIEVVPVSMRHETEPMWAWPTASDYCG